MLPSSRRTTSHSPALTILATRSKGRRGALAASSISRGGSTSRWSKRGILEDLVRTAVEEQQLAVRRPSPAHRAPASARWWAAPRAQAAIASDLDYGARLIDDRQRARLSGGPVRYSMATGRAS